MTPIFKCLLCKRDIERSTKTFWIKKGHLLCSTCLDNIDKKKTWVVKFRIILFTLFLNPGAIPAKKQFIITAIITANKKIIAINY